MKKFILAWIMCGLIIVKLGIIDGQAYSLPRERAFVVEERILLKALPSDKEDLRVWVPYPVSDAYQVIDDFKIVSPFDADIIVDRKYANKIIYLKSKGSAADVKELEIILSFKVERKEYNPSSDFPYDGDGSDIERFLKPDRFVPVNGRIKSLAMEITKGKMDELEKARAIYDYIIDELTYSKDDPKVCGIGDSLLTLKHKKGICTDYHSLFISLVRSLGIPAKFEIGFRIPEEKAEGKLDGYHCWAKFYIEGKGWIPVDISEADKHPEKRDYFFGHIDENRVHFTSGRDIVLEYAKGKKPLNFFIYPYTELNGVQFTNIDVEVSFKNSREGVIE